MITTYSHIILKILLSTILVILFECNVTSQEIGTCKIEHKDMKVSKIRFSLTFSKINYPFCVWQLYGNERIGLIGSYLEILTFKPKKRDILFLGIDNTAYYAKNDRYLFNIFTPNIKYRYWYESCHPYIVADLFFAVGPTLINRKEEPTNKGVNFSIDLEILYRKRIGIYSKYSYLIMENNVNNVNFKNEKNASLLDLGIVLYFIR